jgi:hypothetical protein
LIDPRSKRAWVYEERRAAVCVEDPKSLSGDPVLPGFTLDLSLVW